MNTPILPFWFKQRQCKSDPVDDHTLKVTGPNLGTAYLQVRQDNGQWLGALRLEAGGPDVATAEAQYPNEQSAWNAAFELYREQVIV